MKRLAVFVAAGALSTAGFGMAVAHADPVSVGGNTVDVNDGSYVVVADGAADNPGPTAGYIGVNWNYQVCASDTGGPYTGTTDPVDCHP